MVEQLDRTQLPPYEDLELEFADSVIEIEGDDIDPDTSTEPTYENLRELEGLNGYLQKIRGTRLLTADEEVILGRQVQKLIATDEASDVEDYLGVLPTPTQIQSIYPEVRTMRTFREGKSAFDRLVESNLRLVVSLAMKYQNRGLSLEDLIQEGTLGLCRAALRFDHTRGFKFVTPAYWWVRQAIQTALYNQTNIIYLPMHFQEMQSKVRKAENLLLAQELHATDELIAQETGLTLEQVQQARRADRMTPLSLKDQVGDEDDVTRESFVADPTTDVEKSVIDTLPDNIRAKSFAEIFQGLTPRERQIIELKFNKGATQKEIAKEIGVSRSRVGQLIESAEIRMRNKLRPYLERKILETDVEDHD